MTICTWSWANRAVVNLGTATEAPARNGDTKDGCIAALNGPEEGNMPKLSRGFANEN